ncbi:MAG: hypothetical protein JNM50_04050 [Chromatiales bacterium]|nr:hypothetical protein [Chromatiales bacterium]
MSGLTASQFGFKRGKLLPKGALTRIQTLAREGKSRKAIARALGMGEGTFNRILADSEPAKQALESGQGEREAALIDQLHHPEAYIPERFDPDKHPGIFAKLVGAKQLAAQHELNSKFGWRFGEDGTATDGRVTIEFKLPAALQPDQYKAVIDGKAVRVD